MSSPEYRPIALAADIISWIGFAICILTAIYVLRLEKEADTYQDKYGTLISAVPTFFQFVVFIVGGLVGITTCTIGMPMAWIAAVTQRHVFRIPTVLAAVAGPIIIMLLYLYVYAF